MNENGSVQETLPTIPSRQPHLQSLIRVLKYSLVKAVILLVTITIGLYLTILIINLGGYADRVFEGAIDEQIGAMLLGGWLKEITDPVERLRIVEETRWAMREAQGLHQPFLLRTLRWLVRSMTLDIGHTGANPFQGWEGGKIQKIILPRLPWTLTLVGLSNLFAFLISVSLALWLSRKPGSFTDHLVVLLSPITSAPNWIFGVVLIFIFATSLGVLPFPIGFEVKTKIGSLNSLLFLLKHMILPATAVILSSVFQSIYSWRTFFLIYSHEDYVEVAVAKGLSSRTIEARYILRPVLPYVITNFAMMMILFWQSAIALERLFLWPGLGNLFLSAVRGLNTPLTLGIVTLFAYLLGITVYLLDILYAVLDPRVRVGSQNRSINVSSRTARYTKKQIAKQNATIIPLTHLVPETQRSVIKVKQVLLAIFQSSPLSSLRNAVNHNLRSLIPILREISRSPSAVIGLVLILILASASIYIINAYPYERVVEKWYSPDEWLKNPVNAMPAWINFFRSDKLPESVFLNSQDIELPEPKLIAEGIYQIDIPLMFQYNYDAYPQDLWVFLKSNYIEKPPYVTFYWRQPDGTLIDMGGQAITSTQTYYLSRDQRIQRKLKTNNIIQHLFLDRASNHQTILKGNYELVISALFFEPDAKLDAEAILYGQVYGLAGTDNRRRDLTIALMWGTPVALAFGLLAALGTSLIAMTIAAFGAWFSGWIDELIQRITEINMMIPALPIAILVFYMYSKSIWVILSVVIILNIFGSSIKNYRAIFIQTKEAPYIEAAQAYGASNWRIIRRYLVPRILPVLIPQLVIMVPTYVFYEATLAYLGVSDPYLPTWGKTIYEAITERGLQDHPHWVLEPLALLMLTGLAFALLGFALDRVLNPRLRLE